LAFTAFAVALFPVLSAQSRGDLFALTPWK
jgi:hypothetical protein